MPNDHFSTGKKIAFTGVMFLYINLVLTIFWILKPLKKSLFIGQYDGDQTFKLGSMEMLGSSAELLAKGMNLLIAFLLVVFLTLVTRLAKRQAKFDCGESGANGPRRQSGHDLPAFGALGLLPRRDKKMN